MLTIWAHMLAATSTIDPEPACGVKIIVYILIFHKYVCKHFAAWGPLSRLERVCARSFAKQFTHTHHNLTVLWTRDTDLLREPIATRALAHTHTQTLFNNKQLRRLCAPSFA